jgi:hypothetical protein
VQDRLDPGLLMDDHRRGERAHARAGARPIRDVHEVDRVGTELLGLLDQAVGVEPPRGHELN